VQFQASAGQGFVSDALIPDFASLHPGYKLILSPVALPGSR
jgi:hypothetical protein